MKRLAAPAALAALLLLAVPNPAMAQADGPTCPEYRGVACDGWFTDDANVVTDDAALEATVGRVVANHGHEIAVVIIDSSGSISPREFAEGLGNTWTVGEAGIDDGIVVLVALSERRTEIVTGGGLTLNGLDSVAAAGNSLFGAGDYDGGITAIIGSLDALLSGGSTPAPTFDPGASEDDGFGLGSAILAAGLIGGGIWLVNTGRTGSRKRAQKRREQKVDAALLRLAPTGQELPLVAEYALPPPTANGGVTTGEAVAALRNLTDRHVGGDALVG